MSQENPSILPFHCALAIEVPTTTTTFFEMRLSTRLGTALVGAGLALLQGVRGGFEDTLPVMMLCTQDTAPCVRAQQLHGSSQASGVRLTTPENIVSYTAKDKSLCGLDGIFMFEIGGVRSSVLIS